MSQQINLYNPVFRKKGFSFTSATAMLYGAGMVVAIAALIAFYEDQQLRGVQVQSRVVEQAYKEATARNEQLTGEIAQLKPNAQLEAELAALDATLRGRQDIIDTLQSGVFGNTVGFSAYMRAFSRQSISGLWLTGFDIARAGNELAIQGRTVSSDLVANYLKQLNQEQALQGRQFAALRINQPPPEPAKPGAEPKADKDAKEQKPPPPPRYLEFTISTLALTDAPPPAARSSAAEPPLLGALTPAALETAKAALGQAGAR